MVSSTTTAAPEEGVLQGVGKVLEEAGISAGEVDLFIHGTTLAVVEIECSDCHGLTDKYPWELPVGFGDEFGLDPSGDPRGVATEQLVPGRQFGYPYKAEDGFLLTARGNPIGNGVADRFWGSTTRPLLHPTAAPTDTASVTAATSPVMVMNALPPMAIAT